MGLLRYRPVIGVERTDYSHLADRSQAIYSGLFDNAALFVNPNPALPVLLAKIQAFTQAQQKVGSRTKGVVQLRNTAAGSLFTGLETARAYVQEVSDLATPEQGATLIVLSGMLLSSSRSYTKPLLQATQAQPSGPVRLEANVTVLTTGIKGKVSFNWGYSSDGGKTWLAAPSTPHGRIDIPGLTPMTTYDFHVSVTGKSGIPGAWSQVVSFLVR